MRVRDTARTAPPASGALAFTAMLSLAAGTAWGQSQTTDIRPYAERVTGEALQDAFNGITHEGAYNFTPEGMATRRYVETHNEDGTTDYAEGDEAIQGTWAIAGDYLCFDYPVLSGGCFRVWRVANCYYYYSDDIPELGDEIDRDYWTARSVVRGQDASCEALFM